MKNYYDSFDCEIQCEEYYDDWIEWDMTQRKEALEDLIASTPNDSLNDANYPFN